MKSVIFIPEEGQTNEKPVEFVKYYDREKQEWVDATGYHTAQDFDNVICCGHNNKFKLSVFRAWDNNCHRSTGHFMGHLNSGKY